MKTNRGHGFPPVWNQLQQLQTDLNHLFGRWADEGRRALGVGDYPAFNVWEEGDALQIEAELPGLDLSQLEVFVTGGNQLTVKGTRKQPVPEKGVWHRQERSFGNFSRMITLPYVVDAEKVEAKFEHGILNLKLVKHESAKARKIPVKSA